MNNSLQRRGFGAYGLALGTILGLACLALATADTLLPAPVIKSIAADGAELVLTVAVPSGVKEIVIEIGNPPAGQPWTRQASLPADGNGGEVRFRLPKPGQMQLIRAVASAQPDAVAALSRELNYVTLPTQVRASAPGLPPNPALPEEIVLQFRAQIDGSDKLTVTREGILWEHLHWGWPDGSVAVNGIQWTPSEKNLITTAAGTPFLPENIDFRSARLQLKQAEDTVALEKNETSATIYIDDTPVGAGNYDFELRLPLRLAINPAPSPGTAATLEITATIDGSDTLLITPTEARWTHRFWQWPAQVTLNQIPWQPATDPVLKNEAPTQFLPPGVNFATARVLKRAGRDLVAAEPQPNALLIHFADNPNGPDNYELTIQFGEPRN